MATTAGLLPAHDILPALRCIDKLSDDTHGYMVHAFQSLFIGTLAAVLANYLHNNMADPRMSLNGVHDHT